MASARAYFGKNLRQTLDEERDRIRTGTSIFRIILVFSRFRESPTPPSTTRGASSAANTVPPNGVNTCMKRA
jgi:hypothetical protein